jgi:methionine biosynthesis protein MetW
MDQNLVDLQFSHEEIVNLIPTGSKVLDLGCGEGSLLELLQQEKQVRGRGVDIEEKMVLECIRKGLSVFQGNLEEGLKDYPSKSYDFVILNQTLQMIMNPVLLLKEMMRVGKKIIVNFPNFGHYVNRLQLLFKGRMPVNKDIPFQWYDTPNIHFCTRKDFVVLSKELGLIIKDEICLGRRGPISFLKDLRALQVCMVLQDGN